MVFSVLWMTGVGAEERLKPFPTGRSAGGGMIAIYITGEGRVCQMCGMGRANCGQPYVSV
jgi:hypothetical protein